MQRLYYYVRLVAVVLVFPAILVYLALLTARGWLRSSPAGSRTPLRSWMSVVDWTKGVPLGYSYWEQFEAPSMVDEIAVHHDD